MSLGQFGGIIGGIIGAVLALPTGGMSVAMGFSLGYAIGSIAGSLLFPPDTPTMQGPRLDDLKIQRSEYGSPIPLLYGKARLSGNVIWATDLQEKVVTEKSGDVKYKRYYYSTTCAVLLCEGVIDEAGIEKIWANGKLIYDSVAGDRMKGLTFRAYRGTETQTADPVIAAAVGAENCPAYRGLAYIVIDSLPLADFGNQMPRFEFLVSKGYAHSYPATVASSSGAIGHSTAFIDQDTGLLWALTPESTTVKIYQPETGALTATLDLSSYSGFDDGGGGAGGAEGWGIAKDYYTGNIHIVFDPGVYAATGTAELVIDPYTYELVNISNTSSAGSPYATGAVYDHILGTSLICGGHTLLGLIDEVTGGVVTRRMTQGVQIDTLLPCARWLDDNGRYHTVKTWTAFQRNLEKAGVSFPLGPVFHDDHGYLAVHTWDGVKLFKYTKQASLGLMTMQIDWSATVSHLTAAAGWGAWTPYLRMTYDPSRHILWACNESVDAWWCDLTDDSLPWTKKTFAHVVDYIAFDPATGRLYTTAFDDFYAYTGHPAALVQDWSRTTTFGAKQGDLFFPPDPLGWLITGWGSKFYYEQQTSVTGPLLSAVVIDLVDKGGIASGDLTTTAISTERITGYGIGTQTSPRGAIEPLRKLHRFDIVESDHKLLCVKRDGAIDKTLSENYLLEPKIQITRRQDYDMPEEVVIHYQDAARDYTDCVQRARKASRKLTNRNVINVQMPMVISANSAAQTADILLHQDHYSRVSYRIKTTRRDLGVDPGDVLSVPVDGDTYTMLVGKVTNSPDGVIEIEGVRDDAGMYTSTAAGSVGDYTPQTVATRAVTIAQYTDLPRWYPSGTDDPLGLEVFTAPVSGSNHKATVFTSTDDNIFEPAFATTTAATIGTVLNASTLGGCSKWGVLDTANSFTVSTFGGKALASCTWAALLDYANLCRVGNEILQFQTVVANANGTYTCSNLLRGRMGSEWAISGHTGVEAFTLLERSTPGTVHLPTLDYTETVYCKAVTDGTPLMEVASKQINYVYNFLRPYAPTHLTITASSGDQVLTWVRRDRKSREWADGSDTAMSEASLSYAVDIHNGATGAVVRSKTGLTSATATYTAAEQATDALVTFYFKVYQISATVGRGYGAQSETRAL